MQKRGVTQVNILNGTQTSTKVFKGGVPTASKTAAQTGKHPVVVGIEFRRRKERERGQGCGWDRVERFRSSASACGGEGGASQADAVSSGGDEDALRRLMSSSSHIDGHLACCGGCAAPPALPRAVAWLQGITLAWMLIECAVSLTAAARAHSAALLAFGADSFVELLSATVVLLQFLPRFALKKTQAQRAGRGAAVCAGGGGGGDRGAVVSQSCGDERTGYGDYGAGAGGDAGAGMAEAQAGAGR